MIVYAQTIDPSDDVKDRFYDTLYSTLRMISGNNKIILLGKFNATAGRNHDVWQGVIDHHGVASIIDNVIVWRWDMHEVQITRAMYGAEGSTDLRLIRSSSDHLFADRRRSANIICEQRMTKTSEIYCVASLPNLCHVHKHLLHRSAPQNLLWSGRLFSQLY